MKANHLWTKDFSCITVASILSIIGGEAIGLPISLLVFDETGSTLFSAFILICGFLPDVVLPVLIAPFVDRGNKKRWIITLDLLLAGLYFSMFLLTGRGAFRYGLYVLFTLTTATISAFYRLAYQAWYPDLIPLGCEQKGYAVSATIYPLVTIVMAPVATFLYAHTSMSRIFLLVAGLLLLSVAIEGRVKGGGTAPRGVPSLAAWKADVAEGFRYLRREKGIRNIYSFMSVMQGTSEGTGLLIQAFYQSSPLLSVTMLGFLQSVEMIGRLLSGLLQYRLEIHPKKRYGITCAVYLVYQLADMLLLFTPYSAMLVNRFACGALGTMSATLRSAAVQSYLPPDIRARVNAFFDMLFAVSTIFFQFLTGLLGQWMRYEYAVLLLGAVTLAALWLFILRPRAENRRVYEAVRTEG